MSLGAVGIVYMMVVKSDWIGSIAALVISTILGLIVGALVGRRGAAAPPLVSDERVAAR
jgi:tetrahydromethanopterin S-methyltransferase subunit C